MKEECYQYMREGPQWARSYRHGRRSIWSAKSEKAAVQIGAFKCIYGQQATLVGVPVLM